MKSIQPSGDELDRGYDPLEAFPREKSGAKSLPHKIKNSIDISTWRSPLSAEEIEYISVRFPQLRGPLIFDFPAWRCI